MTKSELNKVIKEKVPKLIVSIQGGDEEAKNTLANLLLPYITGLISKYKSTIDDDIEAVASEIFMKLLNKLHTIDITKSPIGFISRTSINYAIDRHRKYKVNKTNNSVEYQAFRDYDTSIQLSGLSTDSLSDAENILKDYLCEDDAEVVSKYFLHNMSVEDISKSTGFRTEDIQHTLDYAERNISAALI